jgi:hypothetical protein
MKNIKKVLIGLTLLSQTVFAYQDVDSDSWEGKAINQLYEKGVLTPVLMEQDSFDGDKTFSRYEVASLLYNTIKYNSEQLKKNVDAQDLIILKALISEYGNELGKLGAQNDELFQEIQSLEERLNDRIDERFFELKEELDRVRVNGEITLEKTLKDKNNPNSGYSDIEAEGEINLLTRINDDIKAEFKLDPKEGLESYELRMQDERIKLIVFDDKGGEKRLPTFKSTIGILDGDVVDAQDAAIARGSLGGKDYTAILGSATSGDIFAFEWEGRYNYFDSKEGTSSDMALSYATLDNAETGLRNEIFSFAPNFEFTLSDKTKSFLDFEYASINTTNEYSLGGDSVEYTLPADDPSAILLYNRVETTLDNGDKRVFTFSGLNTGVDFDISGIGDINKRPFRETDLVKTERNIMGSVMGAEYKGRELDSSFYYSAYGTNNPSDEKQERYKLSTMYSPRREDYKLGLDILQDKSLDYDFAMNGELDTRYIAVPKLYLNDILKEDSQNKFMYAAIKTRSSDIDSWKVYGDHTQFLDEGKTVKYASQYFDNRENKSKNLEFGWNHERINMTVGEKEKAKPADLLFGARYTDLKYDTRNLDDEREFRFFFAQKIYYEHWTVLYGAKYQYTWDRENYNSSMKDHDMSNNLTAGLEFDYNFSDDVKLGLVFGPAEIYENDDEDKFLYDRTSAFDGEQNQASVKLTAKF